MQMHHATLVIDYYSLDCMFSDAGDGFFAQTLMH